MSKASQQSKAPNTAESFGDIRKRWLNWLDDDPVQSIWKQIYGMVWDDATFRMPNKSRSLTTGTAYLSQNGTLARFVDSAYIAGQTLAMARLVDTRSDVISLGRLLKEMRQHRGLFTRSAYLAIDDLPYDYGPVRDDALARMMATAKDGVSFSWEPTSGPEAWSVAERLHRDFDAMSGVDRSARQPSDTISEELIDKLESWLNDPTVKRIVKLRHKYVAHAADARSRAGLPGGLTMNDIAAAHRAVFRVAAAISSFVLYHDSHSNPLPTPQYDQLEYWDRALVPTEKVADLHKSWDAYEEQRSKWSDDLADEFLGPRGDE